MSAIPSRDRHDGGMRPTPFESAHAAPAGPRPTRWWLWLLGASLCALAVVAVFQAFVGSSTGQVVEYRAFQAVEPAPGEAFGPSLATSALRYAPFVALGCAGLGVIVQLARRHWQSAVAVVVAVAQVAAPAELQASVPAAVSSAPVARLEAVQRLVRSVVEAVAVGVSRSARRGKNLKRSNHQ